MEALPGRFRRFQHMFAIGLIAGGIVRRELQHALRVPETGIEARESQILPAQDRLCALADRAQVAKVARHQLKAVLHAIGKRAPQDGLIEQIGDAANVRDAVKRSVETLGLLQLLQGVPGRLQGLCDGAHVNHRQLSVSRSAGPDTRRDGQRRPHHPFPHISYSIPYARPSASGA